MFQSICSLVDAPKLFLLAQAILHLESQTTRQLEDFLNRTACLFHFAKLKENHPSAEDGDHLSFSLLYSSRRDVS